MFVHKEEYGVEGRAIFNLKIISLLCKKIILVTTYKLVVGVKFEAERRDVLIVLVSSINLDTISVETTWKKMKTWLSLKVHTLSPGTLETIQWMNWRLGGWRAGIPV